MQRLKIFTLIFLNLGGMIGITTCFADDANVLSSPQFTLARHTVDKTLQARGFAYSALSAEEKRAFLQELFIRENLLAQQSIIPSEQLNKFEQRMADYRQGQLAKLTLEALANVGMPDFTARAREIYLARKDDAYFLPLRLRVRVLEKSLLKNKTKALAELAKIHDDITAGKLDFTTAVLKYSDDPNKKLTNGDSYWFHQGQKSELLYSVAEKLNSDNKLSEVIVSDKTAYLLEFIGRQEAFSQSFAEVKESIMTELQDEYQGQQRQQILTELKKRFDLEVTIHPDFK